MPLIVDTHVHVVADDHTRYPLRPGVATNRWYETHPCSAPQLLTLMREAGVHRAVLVQGVGAYGFDNRYLLDSAVAYPGVFTSVVCTDRTRATAVDDLTALVRAGARGYRWFTVGDDPRLAEPSVVWDALAAMAIPVVVTILADRLPELASLVARLPPVPLAIDHCAFADLGAGVPDELAALASFRNVHCKVSTHALRSAAAGGDPADALGALADRFDGRIMWGSDFSQTHDVPYAELVEEGRRAAAKLDEDRRDAFLGGTALRLWPELA
jgi:predicted TIM-barrel fold metal-dependent hydrolase